MRHNIMSIDHYEQLVGPETVERIRGKACALGDFHVSHFNATYYGGGVAEILSSLTLLMNSVDVRTEWRVLLGSQDFFAITKRMHNALQGGSIDFSQIKQEIYETVIAENAVRNPKIANFVGVEDPW